MKQANVFIFLYYDSQIFRVKNASHRVYVDQEFDSLDPGIALEEAKPSALERWMEAQVLPGDTLQAIALRFNCTVGS